MNRMKGDRMMGEQMIKSVLVSYEALKAFCEEAFHRFGFEPAQSERITDVLLAADLYGIDSHGTNRIVLYHEQIRSGFIDVAAQPEVVFATPVSAVIDGNRGMGQLVSVRAMEEAIRLASASGVGLVTVRNSNHHGIAGYYSRLAAQEGFLGIAMTNSLKAVVPTFARVPVLGTNPMAVTYPGNPVPFHFDASTSVVTAGKFEVYHKQGHPIPAGWGINAAGEEETDPGAVLEAMKTGQGGIHPLGGGGEIHGGHKGYGFAMLAEIFSSILSQGITSNHVEEADTAGVCHFFAAIDPALFGDAAAISDHLERFLTELREAPKAQGQERIYIHGEKEAECYDRRKAEGIRINPAVLREMRDMAQDLNMVLEDYFPAI